MMLGTEMTSITDWPELCKEMRQIDNSLRCAICFDFMKTAMVIPNCSHNYCSLCIRSYISSCKSQCPACNGNVNELELRNNRALDTIIENFTAIRSRLLEIFRVQSSINKTAARLSPLKKSVTAPPLPSSRPSRSVAKPKTEPAQDSDSQSDPPPRIRPSRAKSSRNSRKIPDSDSDYEEDIINCDSGSDDDFDLSLTSSTSKRKPTGKTNKGKRLASSSLLNSPKSSRALLANTQRTPESKVTSFSKASASDKDDDSVEYKVSSRDESCDRPVSASAELPDLPSSTSTKTPLSPSATSGQWSFLSPPSASTSMPHTSQAAPSTPSRQPSFPSNSFPSTQAAATTPGKLPSLTSPGASSYGRVDCPVCRVSIPQTNINKHLDMCLNSDAKKESLRSKAPKRKPLPKLVYNLMKDSEIKKRLKALGLPTDGDKNAMIKRHKEYCILYNAECDSETPKSEMEIVHLVKKNEATKIKMTASATNKGKLVIEKGASEVQVENAQKSYAKEHKDHFSSLIAETKRRMREKRDLLKKKKTETSEDAECVVIDDNSSTSTEPTESSHQEPTDVRVNTETSSVPSDPGTNGSDQSDTTVKELALHESTTDCDTTADMSSTNAMPGMTCQAITDIEETLQTETTKSSYFPDDVMDALSLPQVDGSSIREGVSSMTRVPTPPLAPPDLSVFSDTTDDEGDNRADVNVNNNAKTAVKEEGVVDTMMQDPQTPSSEDECPDSPSILTPFPSTPQSFPGDTGDEGPTQSGANVSTQPFGGSVFELPRSKTTPLKDSQKSNASSFMPFTQVAPPSPGSTASSEKSMFDLQKSDFKLIGDQVPTTPHWSPSPAKQEPGKKLRVKTKGKGKKRPLTSEQSDTESVDSKRSRSEVADVMIEESSSVRRSSRRQRQKPANH